MRELFSQGYTAHPGNAARKVNSSVKSRGYPKLDSPCFLQMNSELYSFWSIPFLRKPAFILLNYRFLLQERNLCIIIIWIRVQEIFLSYIKNLIYNALSQWLLRFKLRGVWMAMTVREAYEKLGGNYEEMSRRVDEKMLQRLVGMLLRDTNYAALCTALEQRDYESAFRGAHTLKGVALNMGLTPLAEKASALTETLRGRKDNIDIGPAFAEFKQAYRDMQAIFSQLLAGGDAK
ncbi:MAG: Hpt domain-containing protein [Acutalibacteraceae bacterium]|nr:Hpt domain-containing protein [Acutalibacteraceae bacterium]